MPDGDVPGGEAGDPGEELQYDPVAVDRLLHHAEHPHLLCVEARHHNQLKYDSLFA